MIQSVLGFVARKLDADEWVVAAHNKVAQNVKLHKPAKS